MKATKGKIVFLILSLISLLFLLSCEEADHSTEHDGGLSDGNWGYFRTSDNLIYEFSGGSFGSEVFLNFSSYYIRQIKAFQNVVFFAGDNDGYNQIWRYHDGNLKLIFNREMGEANVNIISFAPYSSTELLILMQGTGDEGEKYFIWVPDIPVDEISGLFSGFGGGAFPYDTQTIYSYQGSGGVKPITSIPSGTLRLAAPLGEGFVAATQDTIFFWDQTQWSTLAPGTVDEISTDPEGDVLFYNEDDSEYLLLQGGQLVPYDVFDTTTCPFSASALMAGSKRAFACKEKPADLSCAETFGTGTYLTIEENGVLTCRDTPSESNPGMLFIMW